ncbi:OmpA family protein [Hymenobacter nivis]|uniref:OmpA family protein n=1 Tax=Hymenobacter nivis TaxID=1850093 RepID=A0A502GP33_9BACT|nr:OmpA family protein [Hymenobacter nivis]TPG63644.1 OmpA family protein [Hymenobacter nivis]
MKRSFWFGFGAWLLVGPLRAQSLAGPWQGVETDTHRRGARWPTELRVQKSAGDGLFGVLYQEEGGNPGASVTFRMQGTRTAGGMRLAHGRKLSETGRRFLSYWCSGAIAFTYDAAEEKLTGHATYEPVGDCTTGTYTFYRIRLKSAAAVRAGALSTVRVSGREVQWFADADLRQPLATGNTYRTRLRKPTTFYLKQNYYPTEQSAVVPITVGIVGAPAPPAPAPPVAEPPEPPVAAAPPAALPDTLRPAAPAAVPAPVVPPAPVVLPRVLFQVGKAKLLPAARPALDQLAASLLAQPDRRVRVLGHTDRVGEPTKNQVLSEERAAAVQAYLVRAGVAASRIATAGYGDARPLYPSPDARNRRVEVEEVP